MNKFSKKIFPGRNLEKIIAQALACKGWTDERKLVALFNLCRGTNAIDGDILEIGSAWGRSTVLLGLTSRKTIWSIDPHTGGLAFIQKNELQNSFDEFTRNLKKHNILKRVKILKNTTREVAKQGLIPGNARFSFIFIDGLHTAEGVEIDVDFAYDRLVQNGIMAFDDYFEPSVKDYTLKIDELIKERSVELVKDCNSKLVYFSKLEKSKRIPRHQI